MERPDLSHVDDEVKRYIEFLEQQITLQRSKAATSSEKTAERNESPLPAEAPGSTQLIGISQAGIGKRTARHLYERQHRGGVGVFDLEVPAPDFPALLACVQEDQPILLFTNKARVFRLPLPRIEEAPVRGKGSWVAERLAFSDDEKIVSVLPVRATGYVALASSSGGVRILRHHIFGEHLKPGTAVYSYPEFGPLGAACWTTGDMDMLLVSQNGMAIRFSEKIVPPAGGHGMRLSQEDQVVAITSVNDESGVFIIGADGKGTIRLMSGFAPNKTLGGSGKIAMRTEKIISAFKIESGEDIFLASRQGKTIRFPASEVPATEGTVQGVICMSLRFDEVTTAARAVYE